VARGCLAGTELAVSILQLPTTGRLCNAVRLSLQGIGMGSIMNSSLIDYCKVRTVVITPDPGQEETVLCVDGETFPGEFEELLERKREEWS